MQVGALFAYPSVQYTGRFFFSQLSAPCYP